MEHSQEGQCKKVDVLKGKVNDFLLMNYSQKALVAMTADLDGSCKVVLQKIGEDAAVLLGELQKFTPHQICQRSVIRDVFLERRISEGEAATA